MRQNWIFPVLIIFMGLIPSENNALEVDETIEIIGDYPLIYFKKEMRKSERGFYKAYNALTQNKDFRISCSFSNSARSHMIRRVCKPQYLAKLHAESTRNSLSLGGMQNGMTLEYGGVQNVMTLEYDLSFKMKLKKKRAEALSDVERLLRTTPALQQKLQDYVNAKVKYSNKIKNLFGE